MKQFDIYGQRLERGHCEVHPWVHEEYPCSVCYSENDPTRQIENARRIAQGWIDAALKENHEDNVRESDCLCRLLYYTKLRIDRWYSKRMQYCARKIK